MKRFIPLLFVLVLTACGFTPLYGDRQDNTVNAALEQVVLGNIPDRDGQYLRNLLIDKFYVAGRPQQPLYELAVGDILETRTDLDETVESDTTRQQLLLTSSMALKDLKTGKVVLERKLRAIASYNVLSSEYTTRVSRGAVRDNALADLARQIETNTSLYLRTKTQ